MIELKNIHFTYETNKTDGTLKNVNLTVKDGEFVVLCGRSGCGKTTITRIINGLIPHFYEGELSGEAVVNGLDVAKAELSETAEIIGSVFQNPRSQFFNVDTTGELAFGCENQNLPREEIRRRIKDASEQFRLQNLMDRSIFELSGGEKQQIACGSIYAAGPDVYVLDEPSSNMDVGAICRLKEILKNLKEMGKTIVVSEHRLYYLMELADRFLYMENGEITRSLSPDEIADMGEEERKKLGLRVPCLSEVTYQAKPYETEVGKEQTPALEASDLTCVKDGMPILAIDKISISAHAVVAVIGENGAGKSTLAESLCGLQKSRGNVKLGGRSMTAKERVRHCYMVMQDVNHQLFCESVEEEIKMGASKAGKERLPGLLTQMDLEEYADRHPATLSSGQKQRVAICAATSAEKEIILYDEPTSGLDYEGMARLGSLIEQQRGDRLATLIITHDYELVMRCCTHVLHMEDGRVRSFYALDEDGIDRAKRFFMKTGGFKETMKKERKKTGFARLMELAGTNRKLIVPSVVLSALASVASFVPHLCIYAIILTIVQSYPNFDGQFAAKLMRLGAAAVGGVVANVLLYYIALVLSHLAAFGTLYQLKLDFADYISKLPLGFHLQFGSGRLRKITDENIEKIEGFIAHQLPDLAAACTAPVVMIVILLAVDWRYGLAAFVGVAIAFAVEVLGYGADAQEMMNRYQNAMEDMNNASVEYIRGITVVKAFKQTVYSFNRLHESIQNYTKFVIPYTLSWRGFMSLYSTLVNNIYLFLIPVIIWIGSHTQAEDYGAFAAGTIFYLIFVPSISSVMMKVMYSNSNCRQIYSCVQRMDEILSEAPLAESEHPLSTEAGDVAFENVSFWYDREQEAALKNVSFTARKGEVTAVVGPSGGGKSTIANLIPRFYDVSEGSIKINNVDIRDIKNEELMSLVGFVFQEVFLFKQSIRDNIKMGRRDATDEEVIRAAKAAQCHDFIMALPKGYDTVYGREGVYLSGGEQQRIAIARAIVSDAPILVLDEATAFADPENEHLIQKALKALMADKTVIMIAHRLSTIRNADKILVMEQGELAEEGIHEKLLARNGKYRRMWDTYNRTIQWKLDKGGADNA